MLNGEQAIREVERRFPDYRAEVMCTCGVYRIALRPKRPTPQLASNDPRLFAEGSSYERAIATLAPPPLVAD